MTSASTASHPAVRSELARARHRKKGRQLKAQAGREQRLRRYWNSHAGSYDRQMGFFDRHLFTGSREWVCSRATGSVLEVAIGTGLNLPHYPADVQLTGVDHSPAMLQIARRRAGQLGRAVDLREGDAQALEFPGAIFDTVVCTFSLCAIPDDRAAVAEMVRVLRPGGLLLLADHVEASPWYARAVQALIEVGSVPIGDAAAGVVAACSGREGAAAASWGLIACSGVAGWTSPQVPARPELSVRTANSRSFWVG